MKTKKFILSLTLTILILGSSGCTSKTASPRLAPSVSIEVPQESETSEPFPISTQIINSPSTPSSEIQEPTQADLSLLSGSSIVLIKSSEEETFGYYLVDVNSGIKVILEAEGEPIARVHDWVDERCEVVVVVANSGEIVGINFKGEVLENYYSGNDPIEEGIISQRLISPNKKWLAYVVGSGYHDYYKYEFQNVHTINLEDQNLVPNYLSTNGGSWNAAWSPDSLMIAFSDYDDAGFMQLYFASPDGTNRVQVSSNDQKSYEFQDIKWSIEGEAFAYKLENLDDGSESIGVYYLDNPSGPITEIGPFLNIYDFWWHANNKLGIDVEDSTPSSREILWFEVKSGTEIASLNEMDTPSLNIFRPQPLQGIESIGFFNQFAINPNADSWFYVYDFNSGTFNSYPNIEVFDELWWSWYPILLTHEIENCIP